jgi:hypothetical protein
MFWRCVYCLHHQGGGGGGCCGGDGYGGDDYDDDSDLAVQTSETSVYSETKLLALLLLNAKIKLIYFCA